MIKILLLLAIGYIIYIIFWKKPLMKNSPSPQDDTDELIECSICHTFVPKNECKFTEDGCICKDCQ